MPLLSLYTTWKHQKYSSLCFEGVWKATSGMKWVKTCRVHNSQTKRNVKYFSKYFRKSEQIHKILHCVKFLVWKFCGKTQFPHFLCGNCAFPQNFHTRKLGEITAFYAVLLAICISFHSSLVKQNYSINTLLTYLTNLLN